MKAIEEVLHGWADYEKIREFLKKEKGIIQISGCVDAGKAHMVYGVGNGFGKKIIATFSEQKPENCMRTVVFLMAIPCTIRQKIFYFTSQTYGEIS